MSTNENNIAIPAADGGLVGVTDGNSEAVMAQHAMRMMQETGKSSVLVKYTVPGTGLVSIGLIDRDGNFRVIHRSCETGSANN
ncbi:hypothetical protein FDENT_13160 [Fusarium denticulatum]|uniref:Uncharacterized protein n=1 Tax=Fusarium denticulatum TaxID=48507 RepID=A0A8H5WHX1_9HYPO|nr:hypothetical protein FDENT_13160 [Fusarium denticulatum]